MRILPALLLAVPLAVHADEKEADTCLRTKIWSGYADGWAVRTATSTTLAEGEHRIYLVTLYSGNEYRFEVCGDSQVQDVDLVLHDANGKELLRDRTDDREPSITWRPPSTDTYYLAVYASKLAEGADKGGVAMAVTYR